MNLCYMTAALFLHLVSMVIILYKATCRLVDMGEDNNREINSLYYYLKKDALINFESTKLKLENIELSLEEMHKKGIILPRVKRTYKKRVKNERTESSTGVPTA